MDLSDLSLWFQGWASVVTIVGVWRYTHKDVLWGSIAGLTSQIGWWGFMFLEAAWGLAPVNIMMLYLHVVALRKELGGW